MMSPGGGNQSADHQLATQQSAVGNGNRHNVFQRIILFLPGNHIASNQGDTYRKDSCSIIFDNLVLSCKLDAPAPCRLDAPDFDVARWGSAKEGTILSGDKDRQARGWQITINNPKDKDMGHDMIKEILNAIPSIMNYYRFLRSKGFRLNGLYLSGFYGMPENFIR